ncbi:hypothetical protein COY93_03380 [Candidatus Uhrbacteria bacterium CG_4_10_14_0_8_um_filter_58_22]|uniref:Uncharacterized protein n=1 Tax=Candidatus Uhrbacteria bacterium CG_4_10_14_0_8_um_filter_58_22 TaxID=1975029 RepID=A0A2M7Q9S2_9BACT|nr:MAG: hypothetical protein AUJ19_03095 [Parcubacteria group bacterium CG1_02_58_44]PIY62430.1 MAG: hypothetical protein COY93_03380 [Candidatus Uhrbacteria bacterium CG_4_10_14_0_8_um_filter_58_22]
MGERCDNFLHAFDGWTLDWNEVFGLGFESAPRDWTVVYRECSIDELAQVAREGLTVPTAELRHPDNRREMELLDRFRPDHVVERGISRLRAIYAVPTSETPRFPYRHDRAILEMKVDPNCGFVGDMDFIDALIPFISAHGSGVERYHSAFRRYWDGIVPFGDFLNNYSKVETDGNVHWIRKPEASGTMPQAFFSPEIMLMTPVVSRQHIRIVRWEYGQEDPSLCEWWNDSDEIWGRSN